MRKKQIKRTTEKNTSGYFSSSEPCKAHSCDVSQVKAGTQSVDTTSMGEDVETRTNVVKHCVFVLGKDGRALMPTTAGRARKMLEAGVARKVWSKFGTFGVQMMVETRIEVGEVGLGVDHGSKFEGRSVVSGGENVINVKLDLPDKKKIVRKLDERRQLRRTRRSRLRRRAARFDNRSREGFIAPSQLVVVQSRLKIDKELCRIYPVSVVMIEDVCFNHASKRWGANFSTMEIGKKMIDRFFEDRGIGVEKRKGWETKTLREKYGYKKVGNKSSDRFESHCCDSLSLAVEAVMGERVEPCKVIAVDDTYRSVRRKLYDSNIKKGGKLEAYSRGTVGGLSKGVKIGMKKGKVGRLCGMDRGSWRYYDDRGKRQKVKKIEWISREFITRTT